MPLRRAGKTRPLEPMRTEPEAGYLLTGPGTSSVELTFLFAPQMAGSPDPLWRGSFSNGFSTTAYDRYATATPGCQPRARKSDPVVCLAGSAVRSQPNPGKIPSRATIRQPPEITSVFVRHHQMRYLNEVSSTMDS